jgi:ribose transport system ATP-binding protein
MYNEFDKPILELRRICKSFGGVRALTDVNFDLHTAEVVALVGENGAGKSTLMKILGGIHQPDAGEIRYMDQTITIRDVRHSIDLGIGFIHQELSNLDNLDIAGNMFLGREPTRGGHAKLLDRKKLYEMAEPFLDKLGLNLSPSTPVEDLSIAQQQVVEIAKALSLNACILIMDEPTSSLTHSETERLFENIRQLKNSGVSIIYITHRLHEIGICADRVVGMRDGANSGGLKKHDITHDNMVRLMVGRNIRPVSSRPAKKMKKGLRVAGLKTRTWPDEELSFEAARGEILGITGLLGSGRTELAAALFGIQPAIAGSISFDEKLLRIRSVADAIDNGIYLVPEDRRQAGLVTEMSVMENLTLPDLGCYSRCGIIQIQKEAKAARTQCAQSGIKTSDIHVSAQTLSGGNQQKIVLSKWLALDPQIMILDEPTRGIDVGSKSEIYALLRRLSDKGMVVLIISSDMEEVMQVSDRIMIMHEGRIAGMLDRDECTEEKLMNCAVGNAV